MKSLFCALLILFGSVMSVSAGPTLSWDTVTVDPAGVALPAGQQVKSYTVYRCPTNVNPCVKAQGTVVGTVTATVPLVPRQSLDLAGQSFPANFMVTATNIIAESTESGSIKATPADRPKNQSID